VYLKITTLNSIVSIWYDYFDILANYSTRYQVTDSTTVVEGSRLATGTRTFFHFLLHSVDAFSGNIPGFKL